MKNKLLAFEYTISKIIDWYKSLVNDDNEVCSNLSKLKLFKLHFFVATVNSVPEKEDHDLLNIFDRFYALPYGPVEGSIYDHLDELNFYSIYNDHVEIKEEPDFTDLDQCVKEQIDSAIQALRKKNDNLVALPAFELVEISHKWPVWKLLYAHALKEGRRNESMPGELIRISSKFYE